MPAVTFLVAERLVESSGHGGRHDFEIVFVDAPVQPADLYAFPSAFLDHPDQGLDRLDALRVVAEGRMDEEVLHVDNDKEGFGRVDLDAAVVADAVVGVDYQSFGSAAREVEAASGRVVEPLVVTACRERVSIVIPTRERVVSQRTW